MHDYDYGRLRWYNEVMTDGDWWMIMIIDGCAESYD